MQGNLQKRPQIRILPSLSLNERQRLREVDIDDVVKTVKGVVPEHVDENIDATITLLEKNLKIVEDTALMKEALGYLVKDVLDAMPCCGKFLPIIDQLNFTIESLLDADDFIIGACTFISLAGGGAYAGVDEKTKEKIAEPFFTTKATGNGLGLAIGYRIIGQHHGERTKVKSRVGQGIEVNIYLPLTKREMVNMMSIPAG
jgi:nitrogen fixation/metabolism regulation signal transduction histidine kinase